MSISAAFSVYRELGSIQTLLFPNQYRRRLIPRSRHQKNNHATNPNDMLQSEVLMPAAIRFFTSTRASDHAPASNPSTSIEAKKLSGIRHLTFKASAGSSPALKTGSIAPYQSLIHSIKSKL
jgi:hypothetical protein